MSKRSPFMALCALLAVLSALVLGWSASPAAAQQCGGLSQQAEDGALFGSMVDGGGFIHVPDAGNGIESYNANSSRAEYCVAVNNGGTYRIDAQVSVPSGSANSFWVTMDGGAASLWDLPSSANGVIDSVNTRNGADPVIYRLESGDHILKFHEREDGTEMDSFTLVPIALDATPDPNRDSYGYADPADPGSADLDADTGRDRNTRSADTNPDPNRVMRRWCPGARGRGRFTLRNDDRRR